MSNTLEDINVAETAKTVGKIVAKTAATTAAETAAALVILGAIGLTYQKIQERRLKKTEDKVKN